MRGARGRSAAEPSPMELRARPPRTPCSPWMASIRRRPPPPPSPRGPRRSDSTAATSCLSVLSHLDCGLEFWAPSSITAPCDAAFSGSMPNGGACIDDVECAKGSLCDTTGRPEPVCGGTCTPASDQSCRANTDCASGESCTAGFFSSGSGFGGWGGCDTSTPPGANRATPAAYRLNALRGSLARVVQRLLSVVQQRASARAVGDSSARAVHPASPALTRAIRTPVPACRRRSSGTHARHCSSAARNTR